jgi:hypothetical protein
LTVSISPDRSIIVSEGFGQGGEKTVNNRFQPAAYRRC